MALSEKQPRVGMIKKAARLATVPISIAILSGCASTNADSSGIPSCIDDPQPKTKQFTLFPDAGKLSVDGVIITTHSPGTIDTKEGRAYLVHGLTYVDRHVEFQGVNNSRHYSINAEPDTNPDNIGRDGTIVTIQADCETPAK